MSEVAAVASSALLGAAAVLEAFRQVRKIGERWWQAHITKRLGILLLMATGAFFLAAAIIAISESSRYADWAITTLAFLLPPAFVVQGFREFAKGRNYNGAYMLLCGFGLTLVIVVQLLFG
jgi:hypothetical protein